MDVTWCSRPWRRTSCPTTPTSRATSSCTDRKTDTTERVSVGPLGVEGDGEQRDVVAARRRRHQPRWPLRRLRLRGLELRGRRHTLDRRTCSSTTDGHTPPSSSAAASTGWLLPGCLTGPSISGDGRFVVFQSFSGPRLSTQRQAELPRSRLRGGPADARRRADRPHERRYASPTEACPTSSSARTAGSSPSRPAARQPRRRRRRPGRRRVRPRPPAREDASGSARAGAADAPSAQSLLSSISGEPPLRRIRIDGSLRSWRDDRNGFFSDAFVFDRKRRAAAPGEPQPRRRAGQRRQRGRAGERRRPLRRVQLPGEQSRRGTTKTSRPTCSGAIWSAARPRGWPPTTGASSSRSASRSGPLDITPRATRVALLTRADLAPEQDVGFFVADVYVLDPRRGHGGHE